MASASPPQVPLPLAVCLPAPGTALSLPQVSACSSSSCCLQRHPGPLALFCLRTIIPKILLSRSSWDRPASCFPLPPLARSSGPFYLVDISSHLPVAANFLLIPLRGCCSDFSHWIPLA